MPNGTTHARATLALALASGAAAYALDHPWAHVIALSSGALAGLILTPDLDVDDGCISNEIVRENAGRPLGFLWAVYWKPYSRLIPHRSVLSHLPLLGTLIRLAYLAILPALIFVLSGAGFPRAEFPAWGVWAVAGLALADTLHFLMDRLHLPLWRLRRRRRRHIISFRRSRRSFIRAPWK